MGISTLFSRKRKNSRVLLVPNQWNGSVQEYYHFLLGYFAPLAMWLERHPKKLVSVRDCGPMNDWFNQLPSRANIEILSPGDMLHLFAGRQRTSRVLHGWDDPRSFNTQLLTRFRTLLVKESHRAPLTDHPFVTVIDRLSSGVFNSTPEAEVPASGRAVRSTPNLSSAAQSLLQMYPEIQFRITDAAVLSPREQIDLFAQTTILIGQHGAGLTNMIWMQPGGTVIEIQPPRPAHDPPFFQALATACQHDYLVIPQDHDHGQVDEVALGSSLEQVFTTTRSP